jgi:hypothetical protein
MSSEGAPQVERRRNPAPVARLRANRGQAHSEDIRRRPPNEMSDEVAQNQAHSCNKGPVEVRRDPVRDGELACRGGDDSGRQEFAGFIHRVFHHRVRGGISGAFHKVASRISHGADYRQLRDVADYAFSSSLASSSDRFLNDRSRTLIDQTLNGLPEVVGDGAEEQAIDEATNGADRILQSATELLHDFRMIVDEGQRLIDDVDDIIEIDEQKRLRPNALDREIHVADQHIGAGVNANEVGNARVQIQLRGDAVDFEENSIDAEIRNVEHHIVFGIFVRACGAAGDWRRSRNLTAASAITRETVCSQSPVERAQRIARHALPWLSAAGSSIGIVGPLCGRDHWKQ